MAARPAIRTPDQRLRVFVSSTLRELEPERRAVRSAIEAMQLAPVMFELGARPHPPRDLYRSYLAQSDVFVGIYWERYGWIAPEEEISGLEDEYLLSGDLPHLMYVKQPAPDREARLETLLDRIRTDDHSSYKSFTTAEELASLVQGDLATLLAERFDAARAVDQAVTSLPAGAAPDIPAPYSAIVGRGNEQREVLELLAQPDVRIVTLVGPGGIGKSRLAIEIAGRAAADGREVAFALLEAVASPERVIVALARALGVRDAGGEGSLEDRVVTALADRDVLLVVDNMEHVLASADLLVRLISGAPRLQLLVTSRSPLRVRAERVFEVGPLDLPADDEPPGAASAITLFERRAAAVRPGFRVTPENAAAVIGICRAVDGVPLAIELAAARARSLSVEQILERLDSALTLLVGGARDMPERQRALRSTIEWSVDLLDDEARSALQALSAFSGTFALASAESVLTAAGTAAPLEALEALVDASLVASSVRAGTTAFRLLSLVRAYARETMGPDRAEVAARAWLDHYRALARDAATGVRGSAQLEWLDRLDLETENLAGVARALLDRRELDVAAGYLWSLYLYLWIGGYLGVVQGWMTELLAIAERDSIPLAVQTKAIAQYYVNAIRFWQDPAFDTAPGMVRSRDLFLESGDEFGTALARVSLGLALLTPAGGPDFPRAVGELELSLAGFRSIGDAWGQAMALVMLGRIDMLQADLARARERFEESLALASAQGERLGIVIAQNHRGWSRFLSGDLAGARDDFSRSMDLSVILRHDESLAYGIEAFAGLSAAELDARTAGLLLGAAQTVRRRKGFLNPGAFEFYMIPVKALREAGSGDEFDRAIAEGATLAVPQALELIRD